MNFQQKFLLSQILERIFNNSFEYEKGRYSTSESLIISYDDEQKRELEQIYKKLIK